MSDAADDPPMPIRETAADRGRRRGRYLTQRATNDIANARRASGLSLREVARRAGLGHAKVARIERGDGEIDLVTLASIAAILGLELSLSLHPDGDPVRDKGHLALLSRLRGRIEPACGWRTEVPMPIPGDRRSADAVIDGRTFLALVEAETHLDDIQALERGIGGKKRDLDADRAVLLVADTRHNRAVIRRVPELSRQFPISTRAALACLARGDDPGGDCLVVL